MSRSPSRPPPKKDGLDGWEHCSFRNGFPRESEYECSHQWAFSYLNTCQNIIGILLLHFVENRAYIYCDCC